MATPYEITDRWMKATAQASKLFAHGVRSERLDQIADEHWDGLARLCEVNRPSDECRKIVRQILVMFERSVAEVNVKRNRVVREKRPMPMRRISGKTA